MPGRTKLKTDVDYAIEPIALYFKVLTTLDAPCAFGKTEDLRKALKISPETISTYYSSGSIELHLQITTVFKVLVVIRELPDEQRPPKPFNGEVNVGDVLIGFASNSTLVAMKECDDGRYRVKGIINHVHEPVRQTLLSLEDIDLSVEAFAQVSLTIDDIEPHKSGHEVEIRVSHKTWVILFRRAWAMHNCLITYSDGFVARRIIITTLG